MTNKENIIWYIEGIINTDGCIHCFEEYIKRQLNVFNKTIESDILELMSEKDEIGVTLSGIVLNMPSWYFKNEILVQRINKKFIEETQDLNLDDLY